MFIFNLLACDKCEMIYISFVLNKICDERGEELFELLHICHKPGEHKRTHSLLFGNLLSLRELVHVSKPITLYLLKGCNNASCSSLFILDDYKFIRPRAPSE